MAKNGSKAAAGTDRDEGLVDPSTLGSAPEGFEEFSSSDRVIGWFSISPGNAIQGIMRGYFETADTFNRGKMKRTYRIEVSSHAPTKLGPTVYVDANDDLQPARIGDLIGLDEKGFLQSLRKLPDGREVWIACYGKEPPSEQYPQGAWKFRVMVKPETSLG